MENYHEKYNFTQDYIEATANKYKDKIKKGVDFIQFDAHSLTDCVNNIADRHSVELKKHEKEIEKYFPEMAFYCDTEYNSILVAGYGSKYDFLQKFATQHLSNYPIIAVNGFINGLTVKYILNKICDFLKKNTSSGVDRMNEEDPKEMRTGKLSARIEAQLEYMRSILNDPDSDLKFDRVILMVHSIDGKSLRNMEIQHTLSTIAAMKRVTLIASMDNYMYQTILSPQTLENYNFRVFYVDTFAPYKREFQYLEDTNQKGNRKGADALKYIFKSFTSNQKEIVKTLAKHMYEHSNLEGIEFKQLFKLCFDHAMISSEAQLKENLLEVLDHKVIKEIKGERGRILYTMEFPRHILEQIVEDKFE